MAPRKIAGVKKIITDAGLELPTFMDATFNKKKLYSPFGMIKTPYQSFSLPELQV